MKRLLVLPIIVLIRVYQYAISPLLGNHCRFHPNCSSYAQAVLERHGILRGGRFALWRLARCHPWSEGGHDPIP